MKLFKALSIMAFTMLSSTTLASDLEISIDPTKNNDGRIFLSVYDNAEDYNNEAVENAVAALVLKASTEGTKVTLHNLPAAQYGIAIFHDENNDDEFNLNSRDFPEEGYGFSNNVGRFEVPEFEDLSLPHVAEEDTSISIKLNYMKK